LIYSSHSRLHYCVLLVMQPCFLVHLPGRYVTKLVFSRRQEKTIMKLVVDSETDKVLGASMCGPDAPEIIQVKDM
jgi:hypothetical protein